MFGYVNTIVTVTVTSSAILNDIVFCFFCVNVQSILIANRMVKIPCPYYFHCKFCDYFKIRYLKKMFSPHQHRDKDDDSRSPPGVKRIPDEPPSSLVHPLEHGAIAFQLAEGPQYVKTHCVQPEE